MKKIFAISLIVFSTMSFAKVYVCSGKSDVQQTITVDDDKNRRDQIVTFEKFNIYGEIMTKVTYYDVYPQLGSETYKTYRIDREDLKIGIEMVLNTEDGGPKLRYHERVVENGQYVIKGIHGYFPCTVK